MPETRDVGKRHFLTYVRYADGTKVALFERSMTQEYEWPFRLGHGFSLRLWPSRLCVVLGRWVSMSDPDVGLTNILGRHMEETKPREISLWGS